MRTHDEVLDATEASSPRRLDLIEQPVRLTHRAQLNAHPLLPPMSMLADQASTLENRHTFLYCGEAPTLPGKTRSGVTLLGDRLCPPDP